MAIIIRRDKRWRRIKRIVRRVNHEDFYKRIQIKRKCIGGKVGEKMPLWTSEDIESERNEKWEDGRLQERERQKSECRGIRKLGSG